MIAYQASGLKPGGRENAGAILVFYQVFGGPNQWAMASLTENGV
jgi:hypothetical protein